MFVDVNNLFSSFACQTGMLCFACAGGCVCMQRWCITATDADFAVGGEGLWPGHFLQGKRISTKERGKAAFSA